MMTRRVAGLRRKNGRDDHSLMLKSCPICNIISGITTADKADKGGRDRAGQSMSVTAPKPRKQGQQPRMIVDRATLHYQTKSGPLHALDNVSLEVRDGEFLCIIGPSG